MGREGVWIEGKVETENLASHFMRTTATFHEKKNILHFNIFVTEFFAFDIQLNI